MGFSTLVVDDLVIRSETFKQKCLVWQVEIWKHHNNSKHKYNNKKYVINVFV